MLPLPSPLPTGKKATIRSRFFLLRRRDSDKGRVLGAVERVGRLVILLAQPEALPVEPVPRLS